MKKNKLIVIGYTGIQISYLNISREEAIKRFCKHEKITREHFDEYEKEIKEIEFDDCFGSYDVWEL